MKIRKGDTVIILSGKDRGKEGVVIRALPKQAQVLVEGINIVSRHKKSTQRGSQGQIVHKPMPIFASVVALKDSKTGKAIRVGYTIEGEGKTTKKVRISRADGVKINV